MSDTSMTIALLDADILVYRIGFTTQTEPEGIALARLDESVGKILETLGTNDYKAYLTSTDHSNYRFKLYPEYKANRKDFVKPVHYDLLRNHLLNTHGARLVEGEEADDRLGIEQTSETCIVTIDKDLDQIPGTHFNFVKGTIYNVTVIGGLRSFYRSLLTGDRTDNIPGIRGLGPVKAHQIIGEIDNENQLYETVLDEYTKAFKEEAFNLLRRNGQLLKIRQREGELWQPLDIPAKRRPIQREESVTTVD